MRAIVVLCGVAFASVAVADVESGLKAGEKVPALKAFGVVGTVEGKEADYAAERKDAPTVYLFVSAQEGGLPVGGRPLGRFMKELDKEITKTDDKAKVVAVWLGEKAFEKHKEYLPKINTSLKFENTSLAAFDGEKSGPNGWGINPDAHLTVIVVKGGKVVKSFAFVTVNDTDVPKVLKELEKK